MGSETGFPEWREKTEELLPPKLFQLSILTKLEILSARKQFRPLNTHVRAIDEQNRVLTLVASTEAVDRYGDIIRVKGWKLDNYKKNPVFLWGHRSGDPPIGKTVRIWTETNPPALVHDIQFATKEVYPFADTIYKLYKGGFLRATSVGFMPLEAPKPLMDADTGRVSRR